jgi:hypothetical protein
MAGPVREQALAETYIWLLPGVTLYSQPSLGLLLGFSPRSTLVGLAGSTKS